MSGLSDKAVQGALLALIAIATSAEAQAQTATADAQSEGIGEIIVTAQHREESLQEVPIAVTAIQADELQSLRIPDPSDLTRAAPSFNIASAQGARPQIGIRGVSTQRFDIGSDSPVGIFVDDVYRARFGEISSSFFDIERVEILRGPQDILFGRNTPAGALSIITAAPSSQFTAFGDLSYGSESAVRAEAGVSGPLGERARARLAGVYSDGDGFFTDTVSGHTSGEQASGARAKLEFDLTNALTATLAADWHEAERDLVYNEPGPEPRFLALPMIPFAPTPDPYSEPMNYPGFVERDNGGLSLTLDYGGPGLNFTSISAARTSSLTQEEDFDYTIINVGLNRTWEESNQLSQEVRLFSAPGGPLTFNDRLEWLVGAFFYRDDAQRTDQLNFGGDSVFNPFNMFDPEFVSVDLPADVTTDSWAVFAQATLRLTDRLDLTLGGRHTEDTKDYRLRSISAFNAVLGTAPYDISGSETWDAFDPKITLNFQATDDVLLYASWSEGFKSGGFQFAASQQEVAELVYNPEYVTAYEVGAKSDWLDNRLRANFSAFRYDYRDQQVQNVIVVGGLPTVVTSNAAESEIFGAEADITAMPLPDLTVSLRYAYLDATYQQFIQDPFTNLDLSGYRMPRTPEHSYALAVDYRRPIGDNLHVFAGGEYFYSDDFESSSSEDPSLHIDSYGILSARVGLETERLRLTIYGANLTDEVYKTYAINQGPARNFGYGDPVTYGVSLGYRY